MKKLRIRVNKLTSNISRGFNYFSREICSKDFQIPRQKIFTRISQMSDENRWIPREHFFKIFFTDSLKFFTRNPPVFM